MERQGESGRRRKDMGKDIDNARTWERKTGVEVGQKKRK